MFGDVLTNVTSIESVLQVSQPVSYKNCHNNTSLYQILIRDVIIFDTSP
jgi:hypothetical protein